MRGKEKQRRSQSWTGKEREKNMEGWIVIGNREKSCGRSIERRI